MTVKTIRIADFIGQGVARAGQRIELLLLLSVMYGLAAGALLAPVYGVMDAAVLEAAQSGENGGESQAAAIIADGLPTILIGYLSVTAAAAVLTVPWARAVAQGSLAPVGGGLAKWVGRALRAFWHLLLASVLIGGALFGASVILFLLTSTLGFLASVLFLAGVFAVVWFSIIVSNVANYAVLLEAQDLPISFTDAWRKLRPVIAPTAAGLAIFWLASMVANLLLGNIYASGAALGLERLTLAVSFTFYFAVTALHTASLARLGTTPG